MSKHRPSNRKYSDSPLPLAKARRLAERQPESSEAWLQLGRALLAQQGGLAEARSAFERVLELQPASYTALEGLAQLALKQHQPMQALQYLEQAQELAPESVTGLNQLARTYLELAASAKAVEAAEQAAKLAPADQVVLDTYGSALASAFRFEEAMQVFDRLTRMAPGNFVHWNNAGNMRRELGLLDQAYECYRKAAQLAPHNPIAYSNHLTALHYDPDATRDQISEFARSWERRFAPPASGKRPEPANRQANKRLRIGMLSDGFRQHPVGKMIVRCLEHLDADQAEIYAYSSSEVSDQLTRRLKSVAAQWHSIRYLTDDELDRQLRDDELDILIDLSGHNAGTRMRVMAMQPAPLLVKWVGGLINTTGVQAIDYLISDRIETPVGEDAYYSENLIRMPDDYIVFDPPTPLPPVADLPAKRNGFITLACFNNPTKLNGTTLKHWAKLMHQLPGSRLLLKGRPYTSEAFCERLYALMEAEGISRDRLLIEGPGSNYEMLEAYSRADIALDPWPYSGGLTTCEAFIMGVPVVTMTGPTFAGRHSATHLINAGMPELVTQTWEEYHSRVLELASDLESLATIRQHLREVLLQSPVCDGATYAKHFTLAMRAIWQRYCEGKAPTALTFDKSGQAWFEGELESVEVFYAEKLQRASSGFTWELPSKIITIDNSAKLIKQEGLAKLRSLNAFGIVAFDPASRVKNPEQYQGSEDVQVFPHAALGDGKQATLYACLDPEMSSILEPLPSEQQFGGAVQATNVLAKLPISTIELDSIEGLPSLDWLILDHLSDAAAILEHGQDALRDTLLIQARIAFQPTHQRQPNLAEIQHWMSRHGFRFYRLNNEKYLSHLPESVPEEKRQATELICADAVFIPSHERVAALADEQKMKLAFLLHTIYGIRDMSYELLAAVDEDKAEEYLIEEEVVHLPESSDAEALNLNPEGSNEPEKVEQEFTLPDAPFMSPAERTLFKKCLKQATHYFEFGAGGSTVWAIKEGLTVKGVESDAKWVNALKEKLGDKCQLEAVDIGPTKEWGFPVSMQQSSKFPAYSKAIEQHQQAFDLILVDGRFRIACTMTAIQHILESAAVPQDARLFIHDFWNRPQYHVVLQFLDVIEKSETAGVFKLKPELKTADIQNIWNEFSLQPN
ncbi:tetratricopeptide repeat protein [Vreelandella hamiltonii]|uniref:protein O-GlcNAc transferase n=1 Tax=Vreelandella hamiltonii TaxID=502829 RepID=A0A8H9I622_9GAMM|nr:tetratricopeptide repeat protein [Halomonas hamiltonii]GGW40723.1 hypothetical protein GCM10007157_34260 [Halomonas hamiltonii]